ncbi:hypothetical protein [Candidatus Chloroploca asiatica]|nr:hypothetical protein [Candidatus Chloroploca asiatica]
MIAQRSIPGMMLLIVVMLISLYVQPSRVYSDAPEAPGLIDRELIGMVVRDPWYDFNANPIFPNEVDYVAQDRMGQELAAAGVRWVRLEFIIDEQVGSVEENLARYDYFLTQVAPRYNLKVLGLLGFALVINVDPRHPEYGLVVAGSIDPNYGGGVNGYMRTWLDRALTIATRYEGQLHAYQILNEQNRLPVSPGQFGGGEGLDPVLIGRLHTKFYRCFKRNECAFTSPDPAWRAGLDIVSGGLHPRGSDRLLPSNRIQVDGKPISDIAYLLELFATEPFRDYFLANGRYPLDGLGYHPYPVEIVTTLATIESDVARMDQRLNEVRTALTNGASPAGASVPFWITEVGYNVAYSRQTIAGQSLFLRTVFLQLAQRNDLARIFWFKYEDFPPAEGPNAQQWGIVHIPFTEDSRCPGGACYVPGGEPAYRRPSFWALRELAGLPVDRIYLPLLRR